MEIPWERVHSVLNRVIESLRGKTKFNKSLRLSADIPAECWPRLVIYCISIGRVQASTAWLFRCFQKNILTSLSLDVTSTWLCFSFSFFFFFLSSKMSVNKSTLWSWNAEGMVDDCTRVDGYKNVHTEEEETRHSPYGPPLSPSHPEGEPAHTVSLVWTLLMCFRETRGSRDGGVVCPHCFQPQCLFRSWASAPRPGWLRAPGAWVSWGSRRTGRRCCCCAGGLWSRTQRRARGSQAPSCWDRWIWGFGRLA